MNLDAISIKLYLPKGSSSAMRMAEISNWSGKAIACSRSELDELAARDEAARPGVYLLFGTDPDTGDPAAYVGEAERVGKRLKQHLTKDFWNQVAAFVSKDENLTKGHIKYLEGRLIQLGTDAGRGVILNGQSSGSSLPESDQAEMEIFLDRILKLLPIMGTHLFTLATESDEFRDKNRDLICKIKGLTAYGRRSENGFIVYKDSQAVIEHRKSAVHTKRWRERLVEKGVLEQEESALVFTRDYEFSSPSMAAAVVRGGASNGLTAWKSKQGLTLKEIESQ